jgi:hypothetical protein
MPSGQPNADEPNEREPPRRRRDRGLPAAVGHLEEFGGALLGGLAAAVVAGGGLDLGMARELLHGAEIGTRAYPVESVDINFDATVGRTRIYE